MARRRSKRACQAPRRGCRRASGERRAPAVDARRLHRRRHRDVRDEAALPRRCRAPAAGRRRASRARRRGDARSGTAGRSRTARAAASAGRSPGSRSGRAAAADVQADTTISVAPSSRAASSPVTALVRPGPVVVNTSTGRPVASDASVAANAAPLSWRKWRTRRRLADIACQSIAIAPPDTPNACSTPSASRSSTSADASETAAALEAVNGDPPEAARRGVRRAMPPCSARPAAPAHHRADACQPGQHQAQRGGLGHRRDDGGVERPDRVARCPGAGPDSLPRSCRASGSRRRWLLSRSTQGVSRCGQAGGLPLMHGPEPWPTP